MLAMQFDDYGGVDRLNLVEVPEPEARPGEALLRVKACGVNRVDILSREGQTPTPVLLPHISGTEVAGDVVALGADAPGWSIGDRALVNPTQSCGRCSPCREGRDNMCSVSRIFGVQTQGGYAEYVAVSVDQLLHLPSDLSYDAATAVAVTGPTAWHMLVTRGQIKVGEDVLIIAAGSGIGVLAVQIAKLAGARVIATAGSTDKLQKAQELGADDVVDHSEPEWAEQVRGLTRGRGVDLVFEHVGAATWKGSLRALARGGRLVTCGGHSGFDVAVDLWHLFVKEQSLIGSFAGTRRELEHVLELVTDARITPWIHGSFSLADAADAQVALESRGVFGKLLIKP